MICSPRQGLLLLLACFALAPAATQAAAPVPDDRALAVERGREAYVYGLPLLEFLRVRREQTAVAAPDGRGRAPVNRFSHARGLAGPEDRTVVAPNVDTLYSIAHLDLARGPVVLSHPSMGRRYFVFQLLDPYTNTVAYVGRRVTGSRAGRFAISWSGHRRRAIRGARTVGVRHRRIWVIGRTLVKGPDDLARARRAMRRYRLHAPAGPRPQRGTAAPAPQGIAFFDALAHALKQNPPPARDRPVLKRLAEVGIAPGRGPTRAGVPTAVLEGLLEGYEQASVGLGGTTRLEILAGAIRAGGWYTPDAAIGDYVTDYDLRARIALVGLGANTPAEATYPIALTDSSGRLLDGSRRYRLLFAPGQAPPSRAFWSLTLYDSAGHLVANPQRLYSVGDSHPPLRRRRDGSIVVAVQQQRPAEPGVNWLPAPSGSFRLNLRIYRPRRSALDGSWRPPPVLAQP